MADVMKNRNGTETNYERSTLHKFSSKYTASITRSETSFHTPEENYGWSVCDGSQ
jgi:hypothetical protein